MIKVENIEIWGFEHAIRGMRNPKNSWDRSDSLFEGDKISIGENDLKLMRTLFKAGTEHRKYARQIMVSMDITAPLYWTAEFDTYKVGVTRNSCSFMHKGVSKEFSIDDFTLDNKDIYYLLKPIEKEMGDILYPYNTSEYKTYLCENGREYKVFRNGRVFRKYFNYTDTKGRFREFDEVEIKPSLTKSGYYELNIGGRSREKWSLHRLVAFVWCDNPHNLATVNHIDGNKNNNCAENLEWCTRSENIKKGFNDGLFDVNKLHLAYNSWKRSHINVSPFVKLKIKTDKKNGLSRVQLSFKYNLSIKQIDNITNIKVCENNDLFLTAYCWEELIRNLNILRDLYLETNDFDYFRAIRQLLPQGYNQKFTVTMTYENVFSMIKQRTGHKLDEWREFVEVLKTLPYVEEISEVN